MLHEITINLHMHTRYSDGSGSHNDIVEAAMASGIDAVIVTDHNVWVSGPEGYYRNGKGRVLLLVGEEIHDQARQPQKNHLLVIGADKELATYAADPQRLLDSIRQVGGLSFLAHPYDPASAVIREEDLSWVDWQVTGFTGIELWNGLSEFKSRLKSKLHAIYYAYNPKRVATGPNPQTLAKWDELLASGKRVVAIGGSDAHAIKANLGPLRRTVFPYEFHFRAINTHLLLQSPLTGEADIDRKSIYEALSKGRAFIGYDLPASTSGFRFTAQGKDSLAQMGEPLSGQHGVTFQVRLPQPTDCRLIKNGKLVKTWQKRDTCTHITSEPGAYRVEASIPFEGKSRGWIYSNPIYITP
jgi:hypothetical protein